MKDKVVLITGGARGIGRYMAEEFANKGAKVAVNYSKSKEEAEKFRKEMEQKGRAVEIFQCDIKDNGSVKKMIEDIVAKFGRIDVLVNNAGVALDARIHKMPESYFDETMAINVKGVWNTMQHVMPFMMEQKSGAIINIASVAGTMGNIGQSAYAASKAAVIGMSKSVAKEGAAYGIRVNAIAPGFIEVGMSSQIPDKLKDMLIAQIPQGRPGKGEEIAKTALFLAGEGAGYITGQVIEVNGGMRM